MIQKKFSWDYFKREYEKNMKEPDYRKVVENFRKQICDAIDKEILKDLSSSILNNKENENVS